MLTLLGHFFGPHLYKIINHTEGAPETPLLLYLISKCFNNMIEIHILHYITEFEPECRCKFNSSINTVIVTSVK